MFTYYKTTNNAQSTLAAGLTGSNLDVTIILKTGEGALFPSTYPFLLCLEKVDSSSTSIPKPVIRREVVKVTNRSSDTLTVVRASGTCVGDDTANPKTQGNTIYVFDTGDKVSLYKMSEDDQDAKEEIYNDNNTSNLVHKTGTETITGNKTYTGSNTFNGTVNLNATYIPTFASDPTINDNKQVTTKKYVDDSITAASAISTTSKEYVTGEDVTAGNVVFQEDMVTFAESTNVQNIGDVTGNTRVSIKAFGSGVAGNTLKLSLKKFSSPSADLKIRIETDNAGSPSGTLIDANATATITAGSLTTSLADTTVTLAGTITIPLGTIAHIVLFAGTYGSETVNSTNYYGVGYSTKDTTTRVKKIYTPNTIENNDSGISGWLTTGNLGRLGYRIKAIATTQIHSVVKDVSCTASTCYIISDVGNTVLDSAPFIGDVATFSSPYNIAAGSYIRIEAGAGGGLYTMSYKGTSFPISSSLIEFISGSDGGTDDLVNARNIQSVNMYTGATYSYTIGFSYISSSIIKQQVLSKTDTDYNYKIKRLGAIDATKTSGQLARVNFLYDDNQSALIPGTKYYLSSTPGAITSNPNNYPVGTADSTTSIILENNRAGGGRVQRGTSSGSGTITTGFYPKYVLTSSTDNTTIYADEADISNKTATGFDIGAARDRVARG